MRNQSASSPDSTSPFDPFMVEFLRAVKTFETGYSPNSNGKSLALRLEVDVAFIEMLTNSARRRGLIEAFYAPAHRNTLRWRLSDKGASFLSRHHQDQPEADQP